MGRQPTKAAPFAMPELTPDVEAAYRTAVRRYLQREAVTGVDLGVKMVSRKPDAEAGWCIRVHVREKFPEAALGQKEHIPAAVGGVPTDIIEAVYVPYVGRAGRFRLDPERLKARAILRPGLSLGHESGTVGTLGLFVRHRPSGEVMMLGSAHVLAPPGARPRDRVFQPGIWDDGRPDADTVAQLRFRNQRVDAALAALVTRRRVEAKPYGSGRAVSGIRRARVGDVLEKSGRTTGITRAVVSGIGVYPGVSDGFQLIPLPAETEDVEISYEGDSGAVWYDPQSGEGVGMLFGGESVQLPFNEWAIATSLDAVLDVLNAEIWDRVS